MKIFTKFGELIFKLFSLIGSLIFEIPKVPEKLRRIDTEDIKENISRIREDVNIEDKIHKLSKTETAPKSTSNVKDISEVPEKSKSGIHNGFSAEEKESTVLQLQILSGAFLVISILHIFNFLSIIIYIIVGVLLVAYMFYLLFKKIKLMYSQDFSAYRDFFLMYVAVGVILVLVSSNPNFVMAFSFQFFPSLSILIFAVISVVAVFLIFRLRYYRNYTYGDVIEVGKNTAYVRVEYDICSNVKPDIYIVENSAEAKEGDRVIVQIEEKILSSSGNKPIRILETID